MSDQLLVGYARVDITPEKDVPLRGIGNSHMRMPNILIDRLYTTCVAFTDSEGATALIFTSDLCSAWKSVTEALRKKVWEAYSIPAEQIILSNTHTHSGPDTSLETDYNPWYVERLFEAATAALADRKPGQMEIGRTSNTKQLNYVRHYFRDENGKPCGHKAEPDPQIQMVKITREAGKDILLMNWQSHPCWGLGINRNAITADYIGVVRNYIESKTDCLFAFYQGAAGNIGSNSRIQAERLTWDMQLYGGLLAERALRALEELTPVPGGRVRGTTRTVTLTVDHTDDHRVADAQIISKFWTETNDRKGADALGKPYDIHSPYHANSIIGRSKAPATMDMTVGAVCVGELAFPWAPYEMFCENGIYIKEHSPFTGTFVLPISNERFSYVASAQAYDYGCYEYDTRQFIKGTAEFLAETFVELLNILK